MLTSTFLFRLSIYKRVAYTDHLPNGYNVEVDPSAGHTDPSNKAFFSPTDDLTILLLFS